MKTYVFFLYGVKESIEQIIVAKNKITALQKFIEILEEKLNNDNEYLFFEGEIKNIYIKTFDEEPITIQ
jgi:hypothetical protein